MKKSDLYPAELFLVAVLVFMMSILCGSWAMAEEKIEGPLRVESWGGSYADAVRENIIEPFKKKYGIEVQHDFFGNNPEQLAKMKAGKTSMDVSFLSNSFVYLAQAEGLLLPLRLENVPNYKYLFDKFKKPPYDPGTNAYCISYFWGDTAIAWNTEKVAGPPTSWEVLWDKKYKGKVAFYTGAAEAMQCMALLLGQDPNNITDLDAIVAKLRTLMPSLLKFWSSGAELTSLFATKEVYIANFWRGRVNNLIKEGHPIKYTQPKEGSMGWVDTMVIPKGSKHRRAAEAFINFALEKQVHTNLVTKGITYAPCSSLVELTPAQEEKLGAAPALLKRVIFSDPAYVQKHQDLWNQKMNEVTAGM